MLLGNRIPLIGVCEGVRDRPPDLLGVPKRDSDISEKRSLSYLFVQC